MQIGRFVDNLDSHVVEQVLVGGAVQAKVDPCILRGNFEVVLGEDMVLSLLQRKEVARVLLVVEAFLRREVVLLRDDGDLSEGRAYPESESERSVQVRLHP